MSPPTASSSTKSSRAEACRPSSRPRRFVRTTLRAVFLLASLQLACGESIEPSRLVEPRFAGGLRFAECPPSDDPTDFLCARARPADPERVLDWADRAPEGTERNQRRAVAAFLASPDAERLGRTSSELERILSEEPSPVPAVFNDLAATLLLRYRAGGSGLDLFRALEAIEISIARDPDAVEPPFNRALLLEELGLRSGAAEAWRLARSIEPDARWRGEAEDRLAALGAAMTRSATTRAATTRAATTDPRLCFGDGWEPSPGIAAELSAAVDRFPWQCHRFLVEHLLPALASTRLEGRRDPPLEETTRRLAALLARRGETQGDDSLSSWGEMGDPRHLEAVAALGAGLGRLEWLAVEDGRRSLEDALTTLRLHRDPLWLSAAVGLVVADSYEHSDAALARARELAAGPALPYPAVSGRLEWLIGTLSGRRGDYVGSRRAYSRALAIVEPVFGLHPAGYLRVLGGEVATLDGRLDECWEFFAVGLPQVLASGSHRRSHSSLVTVGQALAEIGLDHAARRVFVEATSNAEHWGSAYGLSASWRGLALAHRRLGHEASAREALDRARRAAESIEDPTVRPLTLADLEVDEVGGGLAGEGRSDLRQRFERLAAAVALYRDSQSRYDEVRGLLAQVEVSRALGEGGELTLLDRARSLTVGVQPARIDRPGAVGSGLAEQVANRRAETLAQTLAQDKEATGTEVGGAEVEGSLRAAERARLLASGLGTEPAPGLIPRLVERAAQTEALIVLLGSTRTWTISAEGVAVHKGWRGEERTPTTQMLTSQARQLRGAPPDRRREILRRLGAELLPADLAVARRYVVVAGRALAGIPFAALEHPGRGVPLVELGSVGRAPALSVLVEPGGPASGASQGPQRGSPLVVSAAEAEDESALPAAAQEADDVARWFRDTVADHQPTRRGLLERLPRASVFHFSGHLRADPIVPFRQHLVLGARGEALGLGSILDLDLSNLQLVVLSSCDSGVTGSGRFHGPSYAEAFLLRGAQQVVGTLWPVEDRRSRELMTDFWRAVAAGALPIDALAQATRRARARGGAESVDWMAYGIEGRVLTAPSLPIPRVDPAR